MVAGTLQEILSLAFRPLDSQTLQNEREIIIDISALQPRSFKASAEAIFLGRWSSGRPQDLDYV